MEAKDYPSYLVQEIRTTIAATADDEGLLSIMRGGLPAAVHQNGQRTAGDRPFPPPALRQPYGGLPCRRCGKEVIIHG